ncbi:MAG: YiiG family protein [Deltaproteobacteria bacterium]|nr:YiiG family protein [Deltaproteobacteria bacterium]
MTHASRSTLRRLGALCLVALVLGLAPSRAHAGGAKPDPTQAKVNAYVDLLNAWGNRIRKDRSTYAGWVKDLAVGPTCKERGIRPPGEFGETAVAGLTTAAAILAKKPALAADADATAMIAAIRALQAPTDEASTYYGKRAFTADACKRGGELHQALVAGWQAYFDAEAKVRAFVVSYNDDLDAKLLVSTRKKYGLGFRYYLERQLGDAKLLVREVETQLQADAPDLAAIATRADALGATLDAIDARLLALKASKANKAIAAELYQGGYERTVRASRDLQQSTASLREAIAAASAKGAPRSAGEAVDRTAKATITLYNAMIDNLNRVKLSARVK